MRRRRDRSPADDEAATATSGEQPETADDPEPAGDPRPQDAIRRHVEDNGGRVEIHVASLASRWSLPEAESGDWSRAGDVLSDVGLRVVPLDGEGDRRGMLRLEIADDAQAPAGAGSPGAPARTARADEVPLAAYLRTVRRNLWLIALVALVAAGAAAAVSFTATPVHRASMKVLVGQGGGIVPPGAPTPEPYTQTISSLIESDIVAARVVEDLRLRTSPEQVLEKLEVTSRPQSTVLDISYDSPSREQAVAVLDTLGRVFPEVIRAQLGEPPEEPSEGSSGPITATVFDPPRLEPRPVSPRPLRNIGIAGVLGLLVGLALASVRDTLSGSTRR